MAAQAAGSIRPRSRLAAPVVACALAVIALAFFITDAAVYFSPLTPPALFVAGGGAITAFWLFPYASIIPVGLLIALRRPANRIGWLMLIAVMLLGVGAAAALVGSVLAQSHNRIGDPILLFSALWNATGGGVLALLLVILLIFPDGHLSSQRWRWLLYAIVTIAIVGMVLAIISPIPGTLGETTTPQRGVVLPVSMLAIPGSRGIVTALSNVLGVFFTLEAGAVLVSIFLRMRGADADRRHQIKWVAFAGVITLTTVFVLNALPVGNNGEPPPLYFVIAGPLLILAGVAIPGAVGIAVLKYQLYDIDVLISRTLVYGVLAAFITAVYVGIAVGIGTLVGSGGKPNLALSIVATAIVAIGFQPVRERVQRVANRLVYGKRATPYEVLSEFSGRVADTYAADELLPRMARVLQEGTGAESATVWLRGMAELLSAATFPDESATHESVPMADGMLPSLPGATRAVEVRHQGELLGALSVNKRRGEMLTPIEDKLVDDLALQAGLVLKNVGLSADLQARLDELRASRQRLVHAQDLERRRLERNLHDGAQQHLVALKVKLGLAEMLLTRDPARAALTLEQLKGDADEALET
jgi:signal transduction histidine kinase